VQGCEQKMADRYDIFVCHASEDKESIVRPLADTLRKMGLSVWYDEFSIRPGDSLRETIDAGLRDSTFGVVVLSKHFFKKPWANKELSALFGRNIVSNYNFLIPVWHDITAEEVRLSSPLMSDILSIVSKGDVVEVARSISDATSKLEHDLISVSDHVVIGEGDNPIALNYYTVRLRTKTRMKSHRIGDLTTSGSMRLQRFKGGDCFLENDGGAKALVWQFPEKGPGEEIILSAILKYENTYCDPREMHTCLMYRTAESYRCIIDFPRNRPIRNVTGEIYFNSRTKAAPTFTYDDVARRATIRERFPLATSRYQIWWDW
jgi:hypothetical protein